MARKSAKRRSDYRERLSTRRWSVARAYCAAMGYKARKDDPVIAAIAKDCELAEATVKVYLSAGQDMGPAAIEKLEAKVAAKGATIEAHLEDESAKKGLREFGNPKRKEPKIPKQDREALATDRMQVVKDYRRAVGAP